jgi:anaerobic ribonucleoside-triphosphate reductase activating protein
MHGAAPRAAAMIHCRSMAPDGDAIEVAMIVPRTEAEGPGERYAVWVQGCPMRCVGCCNPEMLEFRPGDRRTAAQLIEAACAAGVEGISLLGGEPFAQAGALAPVAEGVRARGLSVMIFSGFTLAEIQAQGPAAARLLAATDLLVDGRFDAAQRSTRRRYIGSDNQVLHFLTSRYSPDDPRLRGGNTVELRIRGGELTLNGWPVLGPRTRLG